LGHGFSANIFPKRLRRQAALAVDIKPASRIKTYKGFPQGMPTTEADTLNADLLTSIKS
jgi:non-heme chloroperoxidase